MKFTVSQAISNEVQCLADALCDGCLELYDSFLDRHFSEKTSEILKQLSCIRDRAMVLDSHLNDENWRKLSGYDEGADINIPIGEIEIQFDGEASDYFEDPSDWTINGDLAYAALDGVCWTIDHKELQADVDLIQPKRQ